MVHPQGSSTKKSQNIVIGWTTERAFETGKFPDLIPLKYWLGETQKVKLLIKSLL
jgi:hypothetical protein